MTTRELPPPRPMVQTDYAPYLFSPGQTVMTPGAAEALARAGVGTETLLSRHLSGDWGEVCAEDRAENQRALHHACRLMSVYTLSATGVTVWVITEWDRSVTTLLLPEEY